MKKILLILILVVLSFEGFSQQDPQYSMYMFNPLGVNPGYAGSREVLSAVLVHRSQWVGLDGAPETQVLSLNTPLKNKKMGLGFQIVNDNIGAHTTQTLKATYAYRLKLGSGKLAFGLSGGILHYNFDWGKIEYKEQDDAIPVEAPESFIIPTVDFGMYYNTKTFYIGWSVESINEAHYNLVSTDSIDSEAKKNAHFYLTIGKAFILNDNLVLKSSILFRATETAGSIDLNVGLLLKEKVFFGLSLRQNALVLMTEFNFTKNFRMGAAYDFDNRALTASTFGSVEVFIGYDVSLFKSKVISPRYF
jgi:type IX secretion system PorP/SprF family membrane protein